MTTKRNERVRKQIKEQQLHFHGLQTLHSSLNSTYHHSRLLLSALRLHRPLARIAPVQRRKGTLCLLDLALEIRGIPRQRLCLTLLRVRRKHDTCLLLRLLRQGGERLQQECVLLLLLALAVMRGRKGNEIGGDGGDVVRINGIGGLRKAALLFVTRTKKAHIDFAGRRGEDAIVQGEHVVSPRLRNI